LYIAFEKRLLAQTELSAADADGVSRAILGLQVGLVALAMLVTRSSVASLQTKQGLPLGTQIAGWATLGKYCFGFFSLQLLLDIGNSNWMTYARIDINCWLRTYLPATHYDWEMP
jgi:hypothetical protein